jgi:hypothetical protein
VADRPGARRPRGRVRDRRLACLARLHEGAEPDAARAIVQQKKKDGYEALKVASSSPDMLGVSPTRRTSLAWA